MWEDCVNIILMTTYKSIVLLGNLLPLILEPDLDLLKFDIGEDGALPNQLLAVHRTGFWALMVEPLKGLHPQLQIFKHKTN